MRGFVRMSEKLTRSDVQKIEEEIEHRKLVVRKEAIEAVKEARAHGDLSENFEFYAAKLAKNQNESRIAYLENMLKHAIIIDDTSAEDEVGLNKRVKIVFEDDGETEEYKIVTSIRGDSRRRLISPESPLGSALMGHHVDDRVEICAGTGSYFVRILTITNVGEEATDTLKQY